MKFSKKIIVPKDDKMRIGELRTFITQRLTQILRDKQAVRIKSRVDARYVDAGFVDSISNALVAHSEDSSSSMVILPEEARARLVQLLRHNTIQGVATPATVIFNAAKVFADFILRDQFA